jgi:hypothetical protein
MRDSYRDGNAHAALSASLHTAICNRLGFRQCRHRFACRARLMRVLLHRLAFEAHGNVAASCLAKTRRPEQRTHRGTAVIELSRRPATSDRPGGDTGEDGEAPHPLRAPNWRSVGSAIHEVGRSSAPLHAAGRATTMAQFSYGRILPAKM